MRQGSCSSGGELSSLAAHTTKASISALAFLVFGSLSLSLPLSHSLFLPRASFWFCLQVIPIISAISATDGACSNAVWCVTREEEEVGVVRTT